MKLTLIVSGLLIGNRRSNRLRVKEKNFISLSLKDV